MKKYIKPCIKVLKDLEVETLCCSGSGDWNSPPKPPEDNWHDKPPKPWWEPHYKLENEL